MTELEKKIIDSVAEIASIDLKLLNLDSQVGSVEGWDSISHLSIMVSLGLEFDFEVDSTILSDVQTIKDIVHLIQNLIS
jgi:acyl carrier protein